MVYKEQRSVSRIAANTLSGSADVVLQISNGQGRDSLDAFPSVVKNSHIADIGLLLPRALRSYPALWGC